MSFNVEAIRADFPILQTLVHGHPLSYLDNAATTQKPAIVIETLRAYYQGMNANVHRGAHYLSEKATVAYEETRTLCKQFINAAAVEEIIFCRGSTEAINLVASSYGQSLRAGDEVLISALEHHSNIVPWQLLCQRTGAVLKVAPINERGEIMLDDFKALLNERTKIVAVNHISNALGTINPIKTLIDWSHAVGAVVLIDGAQAMAHTFVDVQALDCDFYTASGHKMYGPTGIGFLYGKRALLDAMPPYHGGGEMIRQVSFEKTTYAPLPYKFEAGTPNIADAIGLGAAITYLNQLDRQAAFAYEHELLQYATEQAQKFPGLRIIGTAAEKACILSFVLDDVHAHDVGTILDQQGIAVRTGHHCAMPVMRFFDVPATVRASFAIYNTKAEIDRLFSALHNVRKLFHRG